MQTIETYKLLICLLFAQMIQTCVVHIEKQNKEIHYFCLKIQIVSLHRA